MGGSHCHQSIQKEPQVNTIVISNVQQNRSQKQEESLDLKVLRKDERIPTFNNEVYNSGTKTLSTTMSMTKYCAICKKSIGSDLYEASCCKQTECHSYHTQCFEKSLVDQINKGKHLLKFKCGTLIKTKLLRDSGLYNKMNLLGKLFDLQIEHCLKDSRIRKDEQLMKYSQQNRPSKEASDYYLINEELLEYQETPQ